MTNTAGDTAASGARFSPCRVYRYSLWRTWGGSRGVAFIGLNPSTADEVNDDPTVRRCIGYARAWGFGRLYMLNAFAYRATDPRRMKDADDPVGPENDAIIAAVANDCELTVAAWGTHGAHLDRHHQVRRLVNKLHHLGLTKHGFPKHPLYLPANLKPVLWN